MNKRILSAFALLAALPAAAQLPDEAANREHFFPLVADGGGFRSYLFLTNAADAANQCALALQGPNLDTGIFEANDAVTPAGAGVTIDLLGAGASLTLISTAEQALAFGYATLECAEPVVARMLLTLSDNGSSIAMTALESTQAGREFQFSVLPRLGRLGLLFSNDNSVAAACAVELEDAEGASAGGGNVALPAQSTALQFLGDLIPIPDGFDTGVVTLSCNEAIAALGLPLNGATFTALPAISLDSGNTAQASHILPLIVDGDGFQSQLLVTNLAETANQCTMNLLGAGLDGGRFTNSDGVTAAGSGATLELADQGDTLSMLGSGEQALAFGYATLDCDQPATALNLLSVSAQGSPVGMAVIPSSRTAGSFAFPVVPQAGRLALVFTNDADTGASCTIELNDHEGGNAGRQSVPIAAKSTALRFLADLFDRVDEFPGGEAAVFCDPEVDAISLSLSGAVFAALPPTIFSSIELEPDLMPVFGNISFPQKKVYPPDAPIEPLQLPTAFGGNAPLSYSLEPEVPGLRFDATTRQLTGTPTVLGDYQMTYTVSDSDEDQVSLSFTITVEPDRTIGAVIVSIPDDNLRDLLLETLGKESDEPIYDFELEELRRLDASNAGIENLEGLQYAKQLEYLDLGPAPYDPVNGYVNSNRLSDLSPIFELENLTYLYLDLNDLRGVIPPELGQLTKLRYLNLENNNLTGSIPPELGALTELQSLNLYGNQLSGSIPAELGALTELRYLYLWRNQLSGSIPSELGALTKLTSLNLGFNQLSGPIPAELGALTELTSLDLAYNQLSGPIPAELGALTELTSLRLSSNQLSGPIPAELGALHDLTFLDLGDNQLSGPIPSELGALTELTFLFLSFNQLSGPIPAELGALTELTYLDLRSNQLSGGVPAALQAICNIAGVRCEFADSHSPPSFANVSAPRDQTYTLGKEIEPLQLPAAFGGDAPIVYLLEPEVPGLEFDSETRQLSGAPSATGVYTMSYSARDIDFDADTLEFTITVVVTVTSESLINVNGCSDGSFVADPSGNPELVSDCQSLVGFANALIETGLIAEDNVIRQWGSGDQFKLDRWDGIGVSGSRIDSINLRGRELKGDIPPHLGELSALTNLYLRSNELSGSIPSELGALIKLERLDLYSNQVSGPIPAELGALTELTSLSLGINQLSGPIPAELGALTELTSLSLGNNQLSGPIPAELGALTELTSLSLGINQLSGPIPAELGALTELTSLSLGNNQLSGPIPAQLGALTELTSLSLGINQLSGPIPAELGALTELTSLSLGNNQLSGPIPAELGALTELTSLYLGDNQLSGSIPSELGALTELTSLSLGNNQLSGTIPWDFRGRVIQQKLSLNISGNLITGYAAPPARIRNPAYSPEAAENGNAAHHSISYFQGPLLLEWDWQGERVEHQTPILGRWAGLAVSIDHAVEEPPLVISRILDARNMVLAESLAEAAPPVTEEIAPGQWRTEYMFHLPGELFQAGNQIVHVIDPDDELAETDETDNVAEPIVVYGEQPPKFRVTFIPVQLATQEEFIWSGELDPEALMAGTLAFLPIADDFEARIGPPLASKVETTKFEAIGKVRELWNLEADPDEFYHGIVMNEIVGGIGGGRIAVSDYNSIHRVIPHEFGHNLNLRHTPGCDAVGVDENYPYPDGQLGPERGWELNWRRFISGENEDYSDVMSYCLRQKFISSYNYRLASEYWLSSGNETSTSMVTTAPLVEGEGYSPDPVSGGGSGASSSQAASTSADSASIALSGRISAAGAWSLTQAQLSRRAPRAPPVEGAYTLILFDGAGIQVYGEPLTIMELSHGDESFWAARTPIPLRTAREIVILDARGVEVLRQPLPELE